MIEVRHHWNDGTDLTFFGHRRTSENRDVSITGKVSRSADTIHHFRTTDMCGVYITVEICFDGGIYRNDTHATNNFRTIRYFRRTKNQLVTEEVHIIINTLQAIVGHSQRAGTTKFNTTLTNQTNYRILDNLCIHFKGRNCIIATQCTQYSIGNISHTRL